MKIKERRNRRLLAMWRMFTCRKIVVRSVFFFQAEDGIRYTSVTGVQTCALPIWRRRSPTPAVRVARPQVVSVAAGVGDRRRRLGADRASVEIERLGAGGIDVNDVMPRSEERRVGK